VKITQEGPEWRLREFWWLRPWKRCRAVVRFWNACEQLLERSRQECAEWRCHAQSCEIELKRAGLSVPKKMTHEEIERECEA